MFEQFTCSHTSHCTLNINIEGTKNRNIYIVMQVEVFVLNLMPFSLNLQSILSIDSYLQKKSNCLAHMIPHAPIISASVILAATEYVLLGDLSIRHLPAYSDPVQTPGYSSAYGININN